MHVEGFIRSAVTRGVNNWARGVGGGFNDQTRPAEEDLSTLVQLVIHELGQLDFARELRTLRWKVKNLGRQNGKQGEQIYNLRCQLTEARSFITVDASAYRSMRSQRDAAQRRVVEQNEEIRQLQLQLQQLQGRDERIEGVDRLRRNPHTMEKLEAARTNGHHVAEVIRGLA